MLSCFLGFLIGAILGSFTPVLAERSLSRKSLWGRSACVKCKKQLQWYDLFPLVSYLVLKGRCRYCHAPIPKQLLIVEAVMAVVSAIIFYQTIPNLVILQSITPTVVITLVSLAIKLFAMIILVAVYLTDIKTGLIPNRITYPSAIIALLLLLALTAAQTWEFYLGFNASPIAQYLRAPYADYFSRHLWYIWENAIWSVGTALGLAGSFIALILGTRGRGMGWGDVKYIFVLGLLLGFPNAILATFLAFLSGAIVAIGLIVFGKKHFGQTIPFGPFLSLGALIALLWGNEIIVWYTQFQP